MDIPLELHETNGITWYQSPDDPVTFAYIPPSPRPQAGPDGTPMASLMAFGSGGLLQVSTRWLATAAELAEVRSEIAARHPQLDRDAIRLTPAPVTIEAAALWLGDGETVATPLQTNKAAAFPPHAALFNVMLTADQTTPVTAALGGRPHFLEVRYEAALSVPVTATVTLAGDVRPEVTAFQADEDMAAETLIEQALAAGRLTLERAGSAGTDSVDCAVAPLWAAAERAAYAKAADLLVALAGDDPLAAGDSDAAALHAEVTLSETIDYPLAAVSDVADWFKGRPLSAVHFVSMPETDL